MKIKKLTDSENVVDVKLGQDSKLLVGGYPVTGAVATLEDGCPASAIVVDLDQEQTDAEKQIDIRETADGLLTTGGADPGIAFAANIIIPPARYIEEETDELDETGENFKTVVVKLPVDTEEIQIILWPLQYPLTNTEE